MSVPSARQYPPAKSDEAVSSLMVSFDERKDSVTNMDGTNKLDDSGSPVLTYDNTDIQNFARAWTGFIRQPRRSNIEMSVWDWDNRMDPMKIQGKSKYFNILIFNSCTSSTWMVH